jgi:CxxC motif-containing protein
MIDFEAEDRAHREQLDKRAEWASHIAVNEYDCPKCASVKGENCQRPNGNHYEKDAVGTHKARIILAFVSSQSSLKG